MSANLLEAKISVVLNQSDTEPAGEITVQDFLAKITKRDAKHVGTIAEIRRLTALSKEEKDEHAQAAKRLKNTLPSVTLSGAITGKRAKAMQDGRMIHSGLIQLDIDKKDLGERDPLAVRDDISKDEHVLAAFLSPSGNGVKALVRVPQCSTEEQHKAAWQSMSDYFSTAYGLKADTSTKDPCRMFYLSHDPHCIAKLSAREIPIVTKPKEEKKPEATPPLKNDTSHTLADLASMIAAIPRPEYADWLAICSGAWNTFGEAATPILAAHWQEEEAGEYAEKFNHRTSEHSIATVIFHAQKHGWKPEKKPLTFEFTRADDLTDEEGAFDFVEDVLTDGCASVIYGASNSGKTFFAIDLGAHVATGREWQGKEVEQGAVLYIALEGRTGAVNRIKAMKARGILPEGAPFFVCFSPVNLLHPDHPEAIKRMIESVSAAAGTPVRFVIIDTMARAMAGGDENSGEDMGKAVESIDAVKENTGAHVCVIHHSGKDQARGARGHSCLRAAIDTEIEITHPDPEDKYRAATVCKQRDLAQIPALCFSLEPVDVGVNRRGKIVTSCVVKAEDEIMAQASKKKAGAKKKFTCEMILNLLPQPSPQAWLQAAVDAYDMSKDTFGDRKRECASQWEKVGNQIIRKPLQNKEKWDNGEIDF
jgi:hypothetical protein